MIKKKKHSTFFHHESLGRHYEFFYLCYLELQGISVRRRNMCAYTHFSTSITNGTHLWFVVISNQICSFESDFINNCYRTLVSFNPPDKKKNHMLNVVLVIFRHCYYLPFAFKLWIQCSSYYHHYTNHLVIKYSHLSFYLMYFYILKYKIIGKYKNK